MSTNFSPPRMASDSTFNSKLEEYTSNGWIPEKICALVAGFYNSYALAVAPHGVDAKRYTLYFDTLLDLIKNQIAAPFVFQPFHQKVEHPFDYYSFGVEFFRPLVDEKKSTVRGDKYLSEITEHLQQGHNVIFLANHQIEADPQAINILLEKQYPGLAANMIFVAGERVITDPLAVPFSMGCNLLCIYSKRYIDNPPEHKNGKQLHNKRTMELMSALLKEGGKCIYVATSGGRDRPNDQGIVEVAPFDPQSIEMFYLMAKKSGCPTFFYPMALSTYALLPPPANIQIELGEARNAKRAPIHLSIGPAIDMENFPDSPPHNKHLKRQARAEYIWLQVCEDYRSFGVNNVPT